MEMMIPRDHLLRRVDQLLDLGELRSALAPYYSPRGRPSVDPELLIRMALIGRIYAITSERRLCEEVRYNLAYRWFCRLPAGAAVPHHSTFSKNRHGRFRDAGVFRLLFENTVRRCIRDLPTTTKTTRLKPPRLEHPTLPDALLFLAVVLDAWSRKIVGWSMANHLRAELVIDALEMAIGQRRSGGVIHHSRRLLS